MGKIADRNRLRAVEAHVPDYDVPVAVRQLDIFEAMRRREAGQDLVVEHADSLYRERLIASIKVLAASGATFCSDDIRQMVGDPPPRSSPNLVGALINHSLRSGLIHTIGWTRSARVVGHGNLVGRYVGTQAVADLIERRA
ncbi:MAG TPA: hypothetical protein VGU71_22470 [Candidatus Dormibacteraeota bacterium]|nr:hypothetical protein [Candidatus Dormibacteraeota bacterium]